MAKYTVYLKETVYYTVEVETDDEEEGGEEYAGDIAQEKWCNSADPNNDFCGEGQGVNVRWIEKEIVA